MILRRPFAILIKHFRLIHAILLAFMIYILYSSNSILSYLTEYMNSTTTLINHDVVTSLFKSSLNVSIFFVLIITIVILILMAFKKKPVKIYLLNLAVYIYTFIILLVARTNISTLEVSLLDVRTLKMVQDLLVSSVVFQAVSLVFMAIRATGFDYKKFNFVDDLEELDISAEDNEEFEVNLDVDSDKIFRKTRKIGRYIKYLYVENKYIFSIGILLFVALISTLIYLNLNVYNKTFTENTAFKTNEFTINVKRAYLSKYDFYGDVVDDNYQFVIVKLAIKQFTTKDKYLKSVSLALEINDHKFYHTVDYKTEFNDLGNIYKEENISTDFANYIMVYKIPNSYINDKMDLKFYDTNMKVITVNLKPQNLNKEKEIGSYNLLDEVDLKDSILNDSKFKIDSYEVNSLFKETYSYCVTVDNCYDSIEYVRSDLDSNDDKDLLKLTGNISIDSSLPIDTISTLYTFIKKFGRLTYVIDDNNKTISLNLEQVKPTKVYDKMKTYIEVPKELENATSIVLNINIRNKVYNYVLK